MNLLFAPHNDDESLFAGFLIQREKPLVVIVFDGHIQAKRGEPVTARQRRAETLEALKEMGSLPPLFMGYSDVDDNPPSLKEALLALINRHNPQRVWAPAVEQKGHTQHNLVGRLVADLFPAAEHYLTYTRGGGKSRGAEVKPEPEMISRKLRALACYSSQMQIANCRDWFMGDIREYLA